MAVYAYPLSAFAGSFCDVKRLWDQAVAGSIAINTIQQSIGVVYIDTAVAQATIDALVAAYTNDFSAGQDEIELLPDGGGNIALDLLLGNAFRINLDGNYTLSNPTNLNWHDTFLIRVIQDPGGGMTLSFDTAYTFEGGTPPTITATASAVDLLTLYATAPTVMVAHMADLQ